MPLPIIWAGRISPDMMQTSLIIWIYYLSTLKKIVPLILGIFTKPHTVLVIVSELMEKRYKQVFHLGILLVPLTILSFILIPNSLYGLVSHLSNRNYWDIQGLGFSLLFGTGGLFLLTPWIKNWKPIIYGMPFIIFYLYAAPPLHYYYLLPFFPFLVISLATNPKLNNVSIIGSGILSIFFLYGYGDILV